MSELIDILTEYRDHYVEPYHQAIVEYQEKYQPGGPEVLFEIGGREQLPPVFRLFRADLASGAVDPPNFTEVNLDSLPRGITGVYELGDMRIELSPIAWNGAEFCSAPFDPDAPSFREWANRWIDVEETREDDEYGLGGYVHSVTYPTVTDEGQMVFSVDFGSAEPIALLELVRVLADMGLEEVKIQSTWLRNGT